MEMVEKNRTHTEIEIFQQPEVWKKVFKEIQGQRDGINKFLTSHLSDGNTTILLTGAGSSAFIGESVELAIAGATGLSTRAIATTDLVTHPEAVDTLSESPVILISFARSGNSPESVETVKLLEARLGNLKHLVITCNPDGALAKMAEQDSSTHYCIVLPEETNDKSLAMTSSFSSMLLSSLFVFNLDRLDEAETWVAHSAQETQKIFDNAELLKGVAHLDFDRAIFLGSGPLQGIANECHLKLQELTDGQVICKYDSCLGFRHGPRAVVKENTLLVFFLSPDSHVAKYENDLVSSIVQGGGYLDILLVGQGNGTLESNYMMPITKHANDVAGIFILPYVVIGQLLGLYKSQELGLNPDNPSVNGAISRVVQGVTIYKK